tara:strand:- start:571 stop:1158 length:588 start_codon:yes stop_codon:yes gene_type:complete
MNIYSTQNDLLLNNLLTFYNKDDNFQKMLAVVTGESRVSLRIVDWFSTNYAKKYYTVYIIYDVNNELAGIYIPERRFKVYNDYKLKLKAYSKKRFDPFCRWERITVPYKNGSLIQTTIGQLNFFKWVIENKVIEYIEEHYDAIEADMNNRNSTSKKKEAITNSDNSKTRKKREELSISATKSVKREDVEIILSFN